MRKNEKARICENRWMLPLKLTQNHSHCYKCCFQSFLYWNLSKGSLEISPFSGFSPFSPAAETEEISSFGHLKKTLFDSSCGHSIENSKYLSFFVSQFTQFSDLLDLIIQKEFFGGGGAETRQTTNIEWAKRILLLSFSLITDLTLNFSIVLVEDSKVESVISLKNQHFFRLRFNG